MLKFGQKEVTTKDFYGQRQITDIFTIDVNKLVIFDKVPYNNGKDCHYIVGYQSDKMVVPLFIKTPKIYLVMVFHNMIKTLPIQCHSMSLWKRPGRPSIKRFGMRLSLSCLKKWRRNQQKTIRPWQVENMEKRHKNKFSWSNCTIRYVL